MVRLQLTENTCFLVFLLPKNRLFSLSVNGPSRSQLCFSWHIMVLTHILESIYIQLSVKAVPLWLSVNIRDILKTPEHFIVCSKIPVSSKISPQGALTLGQILRKYLIFDTLIFLLFELCLNFGLKNLTKCQNFNNIAWNRQKSAKFCQSPSNF